MEKRDKSCRNHPDREAVGICAACGAPICQQCVAEKQGGKFLCFDCALESSLDDFSEWEQKRVQHGEKKRAEADLYRKKKEEKEGKRAYRTFITICLVLIAFEIGVLAADYILQIKEENSFISSHGIELRYSRDLTMNDLHMIGVAIESYQSENNGALPKELGTLTTGYMATLPEDPLTGHAYTYDIEGGEYIVGSPNPELYGLSSLVNRNGRIYHEEIK